jgi:purine nucleosidase
VASLLPRTPARFRVILDNDFSGDPDDLFQLVHHVLSPSVDIRFVIGSHLRAGDGFDASDTQADNAARVATDLLALMGREDIPVIAGSNVAMADRATPVDTPAARAIVAEALRDVPEPLFFCAGGGLTEIASALLLEPAIADRLTVIWIGGAEHPGIPMAPGAPQLEYNLAIDVASAQSVFDGTVPLWQVPRDAYRQPMITYAELDGRVAPCGPVGERLRDSIATVQEMTARFGMRIGETYLLGDQPLVLLTALQVSFEPDPSSSTWVATPRPGINDDGTYEQRPDRAPIRVYRTVDGRLAVADLIAKLELAYR